MTREVRRRGITRMGREIEGRREVVRGSLRVRKEMFSFLALAPSPAVGSRFLDRTMGCLFGKGDCTVVGRTL